MERYAHGGCHDTDTILYDFSVNVNPLGLPKRVRQILCEQVDLFCAYPDPQCVHLREALAQAEQTAVEQIACGNGAVEMLYKLLGVYQPKRVLIPAPTFVEYEKAVCEQGGKVCYFDMPAPYRLTTRILDAITEEMDMMILCVPNNPTGFVPDAGLLAAIAERCDRAQVRLLLDACFIEFVADPGVKQQLQTLLATYANVVILKAFTKFYAMAGLRLGYMLSSDTMLIRQIMQYGPCWNVSVPAQLAGIAALQDTAYIEDTAAWLDAERTYMLQSLKRLPLRVYDSAANYILFYSARPLEVPLQRFGIAVRSCENYRGLGKGYYRTAVREHAENERLILALNRILAPEIDDREE